MAQRTQTTTKAWNKARWTSLALLLSLLFVTPVLADIETLDEPETNVDTQASEIGTHRSASVQSGYRFVTPDGPTAAASPYGRLKSGVSGGFSADTLGSDLKLTVDGNFLHPDDYHTELFFDYGGQVRFHAESQALWHNLLREQVNPGTLVLRELDSGQVYGVRSATTQVDTRVRLGNNPFHLNLGYWELQREGYAQLRFSDHYFGTATSSIITEARRVDSRTREGNIGLDGHLGPVDISYGFRIRDFSNNAADPRYAFTNNAGGTLTPGVQAHDVIPDSRVTSHTVKLFSDLSGGLVGSLAYNLTQRENDGSQGDAVPSARPSDMIHSVAGDLSFTPSKRHSFALKYRHREIDRSTPESLFYPYSQIPAGTPPGVYTATPGVLLVRPAPSAVKDTLTLSATFRPAPKVIYRLEYSAELESRDNVRNAQTPAGSPDALHSDRRQTHSGTAAFYWRPLNGVKLNASYRYATCDNPAYGASFGDQHTGKLLLTYAGKGSWGVTGSYIARYENGESSAWTVPATNLVIAETAVTKNLPRTSRSNSANAGFWFSPLERLTFTTSYSLLQTDIDQTALLTNLSQNALVATNYRSTAHVYGVDALYAATEQLDLSLAFQQVRSSARFDVPAGAGFSTTNAAPNPPTAYSSAGISDLTRLDTTETGASARADWRFTALLSCALDYSFRRYDSGNPVYDGSVHATMLSLKARW